MRVFSLFRSRSRRPDPALAHALASAQLDAIRCARRDGAEAALHAAHWNRLADAPLPARLLRETIDLLVGRPSPEDYEVLLDAWLEIQTARAALSRSERALMRCVRDAAVAYQRGASPEQAIQAGWSRHGIGDQLPPETANAAVELGSRVPA
jgi:hypothetical protein